MIYQSHNITQMYRIIRRLLFVFPPEVAHTLSLRLLSILPNMLFPKPVSMPIECMGLKFIHRVGLAAGFDKNAQYLTALAKLGFAFIEVGTVTPRPQTGNSKPRLFRLEKSQGLINRMGFNNLGVDNLVMNIRSSKYSGILGVNIGKNKDTSLRYAAEDYIYCMRRVYQYADDLTINISSPNTEDLRKLQSQDYLDEFVGKIACEHAKLQAKFVKDVPLAIKISPDEKHDLLKNLAKVAIKYKISAIIATNTSMSRNNVVDDIDEQGGLSGKPISSMALDTLTAIKSVVGDKVDLIGVGGISDLPSAQAKLDNGAKLLQVYTGLIYNGPNFVYDLQRKLGFFDNRSLEF